jgi:hypothetical protein
MNYDPTKALVYEFLRGISEGKPFLRGNLIVREVMKSCFPDWVKWKGDVTMRDVDIQAGSIMERWEADSDAEFEIIEHAPDGSKAQDLLGGAMEIKAPWYEGKTEPE